MSKKYVTSPEIFDKEVFHPEGLFSEQIFGPIKDYTCQCGYIKHSGTCNKCGVDYVKSDVRSQRAAYIKLPDSVEVIAPQLFFIILKNKEIDQKFNQYSLDLDEVYEYVNKTTNQQIKQMVKMYPHYLHITEIYVIPPAYRPITGTHKKFIADSINSKYKSILEQIREYNQQNSIESKKYNRMVIQKLFYELYLEEIIGKISQKKGLIRKNILGKRVDFSGRTVIVPDYTLSSDTIKVPYRILVDIFEPYILYHYKGSIIDAYRDLKKKDQEISPRLKEAIKNICVEVPVLINRQPTLHQLSLRGYYCIPSESNVISIPPIIVDGFNADFDGDQMAIYAPMLHEEIEEIKTKMINHRNLLQHGTLTFLSISQFSYGAYILSKTEPDPSKVKKVLEGTTNIKNIEDLIEQEELSYDDTVFIENINFYTTVGRLILSLYLEELITYPLNKKKMNEIITNKLLKIQETRDVKYSDIEKVDILLKKHLAKIPMTLSIRSFGDIYLNKEFSEEIKEMRKIPNTNVKKLKDYHKKLSGYVRNSNLNSIKDILSSGAKGGYSSLYQILVSRGFVVDTLDRKVPYYINSSLFEGLSVKDMFIMSYGSRKGSLDRSLNTATTGYLMRKIVFAIQDVEYDNTIEDCGATPILKVTLTDENYRGYLFRTFYDPQTDTNQILNISNYKKYINKEVIFYSPINCKSKKICKKCLGDFDRIFNSRYIGLISAQSLGERVTQLIMRTFHTGGTVSDIREEIDSKYFITKDHNIYYVNEDFVIEEIDYIHDSDDDQTSVSKGELLHDLYIKTDTDYELFIPKGVFLEQDFTVKQKIKQNTVAFTIKSSSSSSVINLLDVVIDAVEYPEKSVQSWQELYKLLFDAFYETEKIISLHFEILISNMIRDPETKDLVRLTEDLNEYNRYILLSIKKIPLLRKILTMGYQGFHQNLIKSLIEKSDISDNELSILEKIILGTSKKMLFEDIDSSEDERRD